jgi:hypothetical protein
MAINNLYNVNVTFDDDNIELIYDSLNKNTSEKKLLLMVLRKTKSNVSETLYNLQQIDSLLTVLHSYIDTFTEAYIIFIF